MGGGRETLGKVERGGGKEKGERGKYAHINFKMSLSFTL